MANPRMTMADIAWSVLFVLIFLPLMVGSLIAYGTWVDPIVSGTSGSVPASAAGKLFGASLVMASVLLAGLVALCLFGMLTRRFLSPESYKRWTLQFENGKQRLSPLMIAFCNFFFRFVRPHDAVIDIDLH